MRAIVLGAALLMLSACGGETSGKQADKGETPQAIKVSGEALAPVSSFTSIAEEEVRSAALFQEMSKVITHPRCMNCHPKDGPITQGENMVPHVPMVSRGPDDFGEPGMKCSTCHGPENVEFVTGEGSIPGHDPWHVAPLSMGWQGLTMRQICEQLKDENRNGGRSLAELLEHNAEDGLVGWAWEPGEGRESAPGTQAEFGALTEAWIETGAYCPA